MTTGWQDMISDICRCGFTLKSLASKTDISYLKLVRLRSGQTVSASSESWDKLKSIHDCLVKAGMINDK